MLKATLSQFSAVFNSLPHEQSIYLCNLYAANFQDSPKQPLRLTIYSRHKECSEDPSANWKHTQNMLIAAHQYCVLLLKFLHQSPPYRSGKEVKI